jgi:glycerol-3-phosphate dehydrogenase
VADVAVLGAGSWGTTFAKTLADGGADTVLWARRPEAAKSGLGVQAESIGPQGALPPLSRYSSAEP